MAASASKRPHCKPECKSECNLKAKSRLGSFSVVEEQPPSVMSAGQCCEEFSLPLKNIKRKSQSIQGVPLCYELPVSKKLWNVPRIDSFEKDVDCYSTTLYKGRLLYEG